jgi:hypothetical protein
MQDTNDIGTGVLSGQLPTITPGYLTDDRLDLSEWIGRYAPSLSELYLGTVHLVFGSPLPGRVMLICYAVREIYNRLPGRVSGVENGGRFDYVTKLDAIATEWERNGMGREAAASFAKGSLNNNFPK